MNVALQRYMTLPSILLGLLGLLAVATIIWRFRSRRASAPCPSWLAALVELDNPLAKEHRARNIVDHLKLKPGMRVLDAGCGPGRVAIPLAKAIGSQGEVVAIDMQQGMLDRARAKAQAMHLTNIRFLEAAIDAGALGTALYDCILLVTVLGEIPNRDGAFREIHRALKPGGILSITETMFDPHYQSRAAVVSLGSAAGFREKEFFGNRLAFTLHLEKVAGR